MFKVKELCLGVGRPKTCIPIVGKSQTEILTQGKAIAISSADLAEWRLDVYEAVTDTEKVLQTLALLEKILRAKPILVTFRTVEEGGTCPFTLEQYQFLNEAILNTQLADLIDFELSTPKKVLENLITLAKKQDCKVILSKHNFQKTETIKRLTEYLDQMYLLKADIGKISMMPKIATDVLTILQVADQVGKKYDDFPIIAISMGELGKISRITGQIFPSCITYSTLTLSSAPGQLALNQVEQIFSALENKNEV